jgi:hypothetical protein
MSRVTSTLDSAAGSWVSFSTRAEVLFYSSSMVWLLMYTFLFFSCRTGWLFGNVVQFNISYILAGGLWRACPVINHVLTTHDVSIMDSRHTTKHVFVRVIMI